MKFWKGLVDLTEVIVGVKKMSNGADQESKVKWVLKEEKRDEEPRKYWTDVKKE